MRELESRCARATAVSEWAVRIGPILTTASAPRISRCAMGAAQYRLTSRQHQAWRWASEALPSLNCRQTSGADKERRFANILTVDTSTFFCSALSQSRSVLQDILMDQIALRLSMPVAVTVDVLRLAKEAGASVSEPQPATSTSDPLNAPISGGDIQAAAEVITAVFAVGTAAAKFLKAVIELSQRRKATITASNAKTRRTVTLDNDSDTRKLLE